MVNCYIEEIILNFNKLAYSIQLAWVYLQECQIKFTQLLFKENKFNGTPNKLNFTPNNFYFTQIDFFLPQFFNTSSLTILQKIFIYDKLYTVDSHELDHFESKTK